MMWVEAVCKAHTAVMSRDKVKELFSGMGKFSSVINLPRVKST